MLTRASTDWTACKVLPILYEKYASGAPRTDDGTTEEGNCSYLLPRAAAVGSKRAKYAKFTWMKSRDFVCVCVCVCVCIEWVRLDLSCVQIMGS